MDIALTDQDALMQIPVGPVCFRKSLEPMTVLLKKVSVEELPSFQDELRESRRGLDMIGVTVETHNPLDLVIIMLGTNDCKTRYNASAGTIAKGLEQVITKAQKSSSHPFRLFVISPILLAPGVGDPGFDPEFNKGSELVSQNLATEYKKIAVRYHADFLDAASVANASETDRQHLDALGHRLLAEAIYKKITT